MEALTEMPALPIGFEWHSTTREINDVAVQHIVSTHNKRSLCGLYRPQWAYELFSELYCERCLKAGRRLG